MHYHKKRMQFGDYKRNAFVCTFAFPSQTSDGECNIKGKVLFLLHIPASAYVCVCKDKGVGGVARLCAIMQWREEEEERC